MLPIPKGLIGQKAIPFMEWFREKWFNCGEQHDRDYIYESLISEVLNFLNQPFTPEMLQEYFEGTKLIEIEKDDDCTYLRKTNTMIVVRVYNDRVETNWGQQWYFKSLNDLITLCTLAGVNLTWKGTK